MNKREPDSIDTLQYHDFFDIIGLIVLLSKNFKTILLIVFSTLLISCIVLITKDFSVKSTLFIDQSSSLNFKLTTDTIDIIEELSFDKNMILTQFLRNILTEKVFLSAIKNLSKSNPYNEKFDDQTFQQVSTGKNNRVEDKLNTFAIFFSSNLDLQSNEKILTEVARQAYKLTQDQLVNAIIIYKNNIKESINEIKIVHRNQNDSLLEVLSHKILVIENEFELYKIKKKDELEAQKEIAQMIGLADPILFKGMPSSEGGPMVDNVGNIDSNDSNYFMFGTKVIIKQIENLESGKQNISSFNPNIIKLKSQIKMINETNGNSFIDGLALLNIELLAAENAIIEIINANDLLIISMDPARVTSEFQNMSIIKTLITAIFAALFFSIAYVVIKNEISLRRNSILIK